MKIRDLLLVTFVLSVMSISGLAQGKGKPGGGGSTSNPVVRASFVYCGGDANCESSNRVRQDIDAEYVHGVDGVSAEFNLVSGTRDLTVGLVTSQRSITFDLSVLVNQGAVTPAWWLSSPVVSVKPYFGVLGAYYAKETCPPEASECHYTARMNAGNWKVSGDNSTYALFWNPLTNRPVNSPDTTSYVNVHYVRNDGISEVFIITPILTEATYALAGLEQVNKKVVKGAGQYHMPFTLTVRPK
jgi:hypothetical protein